MRELVEEMKEIANFSKVIYTSSLTENNFNIDLLLKELKESMNNVKFQ
jgi:hypothetical protein